MTCDEVQSLLLDYVEGVLPAADAQSVQAHVSACPACRAAYRETRQLIGELSAARSVEQRAWTETAEAPAQADHPPTLTRLGDFEILEELGRGGMGVVYRARQVSLNRMVALKVLTARLVQSERAIARFQKEAQAAARLHHTNIVPVYAQGQQDGCFYYAMELVDGRSLDKLLRESDIFARGSLSPAEVGHAPDADADTSVQPAATTPSVAPDRAAHAGGGTRLLSRSAALVRSAAATLLGSGIRAGRPPRDYRRMARLVAEAADGLHHAHQQGVVHRDIKPQNLLLGRDDRLHITDFGLARLLDEPGLTLSTEMVGTPAYMAPEQIAGGGRGIDRRTDVYSLGVTLYELLTQRRPFEADSYERLIHQILHREPPPPRRLDARIPRDLDTICLRAMEKEPSRRFSSAAELARDLRRYAEHRPIVSRRIGPVGRLARWVRRHPARTAAIAASVLLVATTGVVLKLMSAAANAAIERGWQLLLDDYRQDEPALRELERAGGWFGDDYRRELVRALASIRRSPRECVRILDELLARRPDDPDAHWLMAWAYRRRATQEGAERMAEARAQLDAGDRMAARATAEGWFFRGLALWGWDQDEALRSLERAIDLRSGFHQAMLHQARLYNNVMYVRRDLSPLEMVVGRLKYVCEAQASKAYPRYLLAITYQLAAEYYAQVHPRRDEALELARARYEASRSLARQAQQVDTADARGYAAEAGYLESLGSYWPLLEAEYHGSRNDFAGAIDAWNRMTAPNVHLVPDDYSERCAYQMRLHFWRGEYDLAEALRAGRYSPKSNYTGAPYDPDEHFYAAIIAASRGDSLAAARDLQAGVERSAGRHESLLLLAAAQRLLGLEPRTAPPRAPVPADAKLSPGWTPEWLETLIRYSLDELSWVDLVAQVKQQSAPPDSYRLWAGAYFYRGMKALAAGDRTTASEAFRDAWWQYDHESYCFRAKFFYIKLRDDPSWPAWLQASQPTPPRP